MRLRSTLAAIAAAAAALTAAGAQAAVIYAGPASMAEMTTDTALDVTFNALYAGAADLSFVLDGYASLDGQNWYEDDFTLSLNDVAIAQGTWNLGGGGADMVYFAPAGASFDNISGNGLDVTWNGGHVNISTPLTLAAGANKLTFAYNSLPYNNGQNAGWQDLGDEGWSAHNIVVSQSGAVPEPMTWALMIAGFGLAGAALRRRRASAITA